MKIKKILVVGEFCEGAAAYSYLKAFCDLGYCVEKFNCKKKYLSNFNLGISKFNHLMQLVDNFIINRLFRLKVKKTSPDLVFIAKADNITHKSLYFIKSKFKQYLVNFYPDNPFCFWNGNSNSNILMSFPIYDSILIWSKMLVSTIESAGCRNVIYFPFVYDNDVFSQEIKIIDEDHDKYKSDVCFVGTWEKDREIWLEDLCKAMPQLDLAIWGNDWDSNLAKNSILRNKLKGHAVYGVKMIKAFRLSKIVLNFIRRQNMTSHNMRTLEVPASKAFLLTERTVEQAEELFSEGESVACFISLDELVEKIDYYLNHNEERDKISKNSWEVVKKYELRKNLKNFINTIESDV
jgi:spore maturation protein CgeB